MKKLNPTFVSFILPFALLGSAFAATPAYKVDFERATGSSDFRAVGRPSALKIVGKGTAPKGELEWNGKVVKGVLRQELKSLETGISLRDKHMKEKYLEVEKYPEAKLTITEVKVPENAAQGSDFVAEGVPFQGKLQLHGVEKPVNGTARLEKKGQSLKVAADLPLKITDYGIAVPSFAGITVADEVTLNILAEAPLVPISEKK